MDETESAGRSDGGRARNRVDLFDVVSDPLLLCEGDSLVILDGNLAARQRYGWTHDERPGRSLRDLCAPGEGRVFTGDSPGLVSGVRRLTRHRTSEGEEIDVELTFHGLLHAGRPSWLVEVRDITGRRSAERAAARAAGLLQAVVEGTPDVVFAKDREGRYVLFNAAAAAYVGKPAEEVLGGDDDTILDRSLADAMRTSDRLVMESGEGRVFEDVFTVDGSSRTFETTKSPWRDATGAVVGVVGISRDITVRKRAEDAYRSLAEQFATTLESITDGFFTLDLDWRFTYVNRETERMTGISKGTLLGNTIWEAFPDAVGSRFEHEYRRSMTEGRTAEFTEFFPPLHAWFEVRAFPSAQGLAIHFRDVTESRRAGEALRLSEERFRLLARATSDAVWEWDMIADLRTWNEGITRLFGYLPEDVDPRGRFCQERIHPDDFKVAEAIVQRAVESGAHCWTTEYRFRRKDGGYTPVLDSGYIVRDENGRAIRMLGGMKDLSERRRVEESLRLRDRALHAISKGILIVDAQHPHNPILYASAGFERLTGYAADEVIGRNCRFMQGKDTDPETVLRIREAITAKRHIAVEILNYRKNGTAFWNALTISPVHDDRGNVTHFIGVQSDITARRRLEEQLLQAQKMEAVGRLAGGVAHDFNNLLTVINGYSELLLSDPDMHAGASEALRAIGEAGEKATSLTRQLLGFSRQTILHPRICDANSIVAGTSKILRRLIGEDIEFTSVLAPGLHPIKVDPGQMDQVLMNLAVNARDAMPKGGSLTIETSNKYLDDDYVSTHPGFHAGPHVVIAVTDTGCGMTPEVKARIFEPFFTTKEVGKGTGLGLAMVHGIVAQSGGFVHVYSEVGIGTTIRIHLPAVSGQEGTPQEAPSKADARGGETVLLVEDEAAVRGIALLGLQMQGYTVLTATDGQNGLEVVEACTGPIHLILTDVVMPRLAGPEMVKRLRERLPDAKVLFMSGYTDDSVVRHGLLESGVAFIQKPFTPLRLARRVREVLDTGR